MITLDSLKEIFEKIRKDGKFDLEKPLLWSYFFSSSNLMNLIPILQLLDKMPELTFEEIYRNGVLYWLKVSEIAIKKDEDELYKNCTKFYTLVDTVNKELASHVLFDGWDVGMLPDKVSE